MFELVLALKGALFSLSKLTPFAWMAVSGAAVAALGGVAVLMTAATLRVGSDYGRARIAALRPDVPGFRSWLSMISFLENGYYVFLAGVILLIIGIYPFVVAAPR